MFYFILFSLCKPSILCVDFRTHKGNDTQYKAITCILKGVLELDDSTFKSEISLKLLAAGFWEMSVRMY
jgi:hypothetical protein